jgi:hypothetical protein
MILFFGCIASQLLVVIFLESTKWGRKSDSHLWFSPLDRIRMLSTRSDKNLPFEINATLFTENQSNISNLESAIRTAPSPALIIAVPHSGIEIPPATFTSPAPQDAQMTKDTLAAAVGAVAEAGSTADPVRPILLFCIPSAARVNDSYLLLVLESIEADIQRSQSQSIAPSPMRIEVVVIDVTPGTVRSDVGAARTRFPSFAFEPMANKTWEECTAEQLLSDTGQPGQPPCSVRQQTRDLTAALLQCAARVPADAWVALVEDDTEICAGALRTIPAALPALARERRFRFIAFSNYLSGTVFPQPAAAAFARHAAGRRGDKPIDHLLWDPWAPGDYLETGGNLFAHRGRVSVFQYRNTAAFRELYDGMRFSGRQSDCIEPAVPEILNALPPRVP